MFFLSFAVALWHAWFEVPCMDSDNKMCLVWVKASIELPEGSEVVGPDLREAY